MNDLSDIQEWTQALEAKCWPYFFMRGVEAHFACHPQAKYRFDENARFWWQKGKDFAIENGYRDDSGSPSDHRTFCLAFLKGVATGPNWTWATAGLAAREACEREIRRLTPCPSFKEKAGKTKKENTMEKSTTLYKVIANETYGYIVGKDTKGRLLLEVKGAGNIIAYSKEEIEEVTPFTVEVRGGASNLERHYLSEEGIFAVGDVLVFRTNNGLVLGEVIKLNSKHKDAETELSSVILGVLQMRAPVKATPAEPVG